TNAAGNNGISRAYARFGLHHLVSRPAYEAGTIQSLLAVCNAQVTVIVVVIAAVLACIPILPDRAYTLAGGIGPAAAPYIKSLSYWFQSACQVILDSFCSCRCRGTRSVCLKHSAAAECVADAVNGMDSGIHLAGLR